MERKKHPIIICSISLVIFRVGYPASHIYLSCDGILHVEPSGPWRASAGAASLAAGAYAKQRTLIHVLHVSHETSILYHRIKKILLTSQCYTSRNLYKNVDLNLDVFFVKHCLFYCFVVMIGLILTGQMTWKTLYWINLALVADVWIPTCTPLSKLHSQIIFSDRLICMHPNL